MKNTHINMNEFTNASRITKEVNSLISNDLFDIIDIIALGSNELPVKQEISNKIRVHRIRLRTRSLPKNVFFQAIKYLEFSSKSIYFILKNKPDVVNAHALSALPIALIAKSILKNNVVYDAHELETERNGSQGFRGSISKFIERKLIKHVDMMLVVSESIADWYVEEYKIKRPTVVLNVPNRRELKTNNHFREQLNIRDDQVILLYQGGLMTGRGVHLILDAFKARNDDQIVAVFMGYGQLEADIKTAAKQYENIYFFPAVAPQVVLEYTASADIGISLIENTCLSYYYCMPNKLFEYAMAGLPVLVSNMKDMSALVTQNVMGAVISDFTPTGINKALDEFLQKDLSQMKTNAYRVAIENSWEEQEKKMLVAYNALLN